MPQADFGGAFKDKHLMRGSGNSVIECSKRIRDSLIGKNVHVSSADHNVPKCYKLILGEHSKISI